MLRKDISVRIVWNLLGLNGEIINFIGMGGEYQTSFLERQGFVEISCADAKEIIREYHYTHTMGSSIANFAYYKNNKLSTVVVFGHGANIHIYKQFFDDIVLEHGGVVELTRLFSFDWSGKNTESYCISNSLKLLKRKFPNIKMVISYADSGAGHLGTIYQASNWIYTGTTTEQPMVRLKSGKITHQRNIWADYVAQREGGLKWTAWLKKEEIIKISSKPKHRYIYFLCSHKEKKRLLGKKKFDILSYPKLRENSQERDTIIPDRGARAVLASRSI